MNMTYILTATTDIPLLTPIYDTYNKARIITTLLSNSLYGYQFYSKYIIS